MKIHSPIARRRTRIEIIPLIDIMFFLLASFMMVSLQMQKVRTLKASLPTATQITSTKKPDMIKLKVDSYGQPSVDNKPMTFPELSHLLATRHGDMCDVLDAVRHAGVQRVAFMVNGATNLGNR